MYDKLGRIQKGYVVEGGGGGGTVAISEPKISTTILFMLYHLFNLSHSRLRGTGLNL